ncbi:MAG TPA: hypothetical protein VEZ17_12535, partial [Chitinophagaceae bacterium]|nr:hypothetical protein [Chitinophagaceae bacterium]
NSETMKMTIFFVLVTFLGLPGRAAATQGTNDTTTLSSKVFPVSKGAYYTITIAGANTRLIRTKGDQVKIDMISTRKDESRDKQSMNHSMNVNSTGNVMNVQVLSTPRQDSAKADYMYLAVYIPETVGFRVETKNNVTFGDGFSGFNGNYSGMIRMHPVQ